MTVALNPGGMKVLLTRKYAERIDDVDLQGREVGDVLDLAPREATLLLAEQWAMPERRERSGPAGHHRRADDTHRSTGDALT